MPDDVISRGILDIDLRDEGVLAEVKHVVDSIRRELDSLPNRTDIDVEARTANLKRALAEARAELAKFNATDATVKFKADTSALDRELEQIKAKIKKAEITKALNIQGEIDTDAIDKRLARLDIEKKKFEEKKLKLAVDSQSVRQAEQEFGRLEKSLTGYETRLKKIEKVTKDVFNQPTAKEFKFFNELELAKEEAALTKLQKRYKDVLNDLERTPKYISRGIGSNTNVNREVGIDRERLKSQLDVLKLEMLQFGKDGEEAFARASATDKDVKGIHRFGKALNDVKEKFLAIGKLTINVGPFTAKIGTLISALAPLGSVITSLAGSATSLVGVLGAGALGAGAIGGGILAGLGSNLLALKEPITSVKEEIEATTKAQQHYEQSLLKYGAGTKQVIQAEEERAHVLENINPLTAKAAQGFQHLKTQINEALQPKVRTDFTHTLEAATKTFGALLPGITKNSGKSLDILSAHVDSFLAKLRKPAEAKAFTGLGSDANKFLNPALGGLDRFATGMLHIFETASRLFAGPLGKAIFNLGKEFEKATNNTESLERNLTKMAHSAENVFLFLKALGKVIVDILWGSVNAGNKLTESMTHALERWDKFLKSTRGQKDMANFFEEARKNTEALWHVLAPIVKLIFIWAAALTPVATGFLEAGAAVAKFVTGFGKLLGFKSAAAEIGVILGGWFLFSKLAAFSYAVGGLVGKMKTLAKLTAGGNFLGGFKDIFGGTDAAAKQAAAIKEAGDYHAAVVREAIISASATGAAEEGAAIETAGATVATEIGGASAVGGATTAAEVGGAAVVGGAATAGETAAVAGGGLALGLAGVFAAALIGGFIIFNKTGKTTAEQTGELIAKGMGNDLQKHFGKRLGEAIRPLEETTPRPITVPHGAVNPRVSAARRARAEKESEAKQFAFGREFGAAATKQEAEVTAGPKFSGAEKTTAIINNIEKRIAKLPPAAQRGALEASAELVKGLEAHKELPAHAVDELIKGVSAKFPALRHAFGGAGKESTDALGRAFKQQGILNNVKGMIDQFTNIFPQIPKIVSINSQNAVSVFQSHMNQLLRLSHEGPQAQREAAAAEYRKLAHEGGKYFGNLRKNAEHELSKLNAKLEHGIDPGKAAMENAFKNLASAITNEFRAGVRGVSSAEAQINKLLKQELKTLGVNNPATEATLEASSEFAQTKPRSRSEHAKGGLFQIGHRGEAHHDGVPIVVGRGEQVAVFNRHQQKLADRELSHIGGLAGIFHKEKRPHHMAEGGIVGGGHALTSMISEANAIDAKHYPYVWGGGHGGFSGPFDCSGAVSAVLHAGGLLSAPRVAGGFENYGQAGPGAVTLYVNDNTHVYMSINGKTWGTSGANPGGGAGWFEGGPRPGFKERHVPAGMLGGLDLLKAPAWHGPKGIIGILGRAVTKKVTSAANKRIQAALSRATGGKTGGGNAGDGTVPGPIVTASEFGGHNDPGAFGHSTASGAIANDSLFGFAELSDPPGSLNFSALGGLAMGTRIRVGYNGKVITVPKVDVGAGGPGLGGHIRAIDLTYAADRALGAPGLENVHWEKAARGGLFGALGHSGHATPSGRYNRPALLVGEHRHEYVIDPKHHEGHKYLQQAGEEMGYHVTPAKKQKVPPKSVLKRGSAGPAELHAIKDFSARGGIPASIMSPIISEYKGAISTEETTLRTLARNRDKAIEKLAADKDKGAKALAKAHETSKRSQESASERTAKANHADAVAKEKAGKKYAFTHEADAANKAAANAHKAAESARNAEGRSRAAANERINAAADKANKSVKKEQARIKDLEKGMRVISSSGGNYNHTKYIGLPKLRKSEKEAERTRTKLQHHEEDIKRLNEEISNESKQMGREESRYNSSIKRKAPNAAFLHNWQKLLKERETDVGSLNRLIGESEQNVNAFKRVHPDINSAALEAALQAVKGEKETGEDEAIAVEQAAESVPGTNAAGEEERVAPPTVEEFIRSLGEDKNLLSLERQQAEQALTVTPDNPNTPENEELPGLVNEREVAKSLNEFYARIYQEATAMKEPDATVRDVANAYGAARSGYLGLVSQVEGAQKAVATQKNEEALAYSSARLDLFKNYGSNYAPIVSPPGFGTALGRVGGTQVAQPASKVVNVTNNFTRPPHDPHTWSAGLQWELGALV